MNDFSKEKNINDPKGVPSDKRNTTKTNEQNIKDTLTQMKELLLEVYRLTSNYENTNDNMELALTIVAGALDAEATFILRKEEKGFQFTHFSRKFSSLPSIDLNNKRVQFELAKSTLFQDVLMQSQTISADYISVLDVNQCEKKDEICNKNGFQSFAICPIYINGSPNYLIGALNGKQHPEFLKYCSSAFSDIIQRILQEKEMHKLATIDQMTGLYNRTYYNAYIEKIKEKKPPQVAFVMADLFRLKYVNDTFGHLDGDNYIRYAANILKDVFQDKNVSIFRLGGDEFGIILLGKSPEYIELKIEEAWRRTEKNPLKTESGYPVPGRINFGYAYSKEYKDFDALISEADAKMRADKRSYYVTLGINQRK